MVLNILLIIILLLNAFTAITLLAIFERINRIVMLIDGMVTAFIVAEDKARQQTNAVHLN